MLTDVFIVWQRTFETKGKILHCQDRTKQIQYKPLIK